MIASGEYPARRKRQTAFVVMRVPAITHALCIT